MAQTTRELSSLGTVQHYGPRQFNDGLPAGVATYGLKKQIQMPFSFDQLNLGQFTGTQDAANLPIPANSVLTDAWLHVTTAFLSGTDITIGLDDNAASAIDANGILTATAGAVAKLTVNAWIKADGALVAVGSAGDDEAIGTSDGYITIDANGTFTAGEGYLVVEYMQPTLANS